jgi:hypothetical protein
LLIAEQVFRHGQSRNLFSSDVDQKPHPLTHERSSVGARPSSAAPIGRDRLSKRYETAVQPKSP